MDFKNYDQRNYKTLSVVDGYSEWAKTYEDTVHQDMTFVLLDQLAENVLKGPALDLACGTGRIGVWLQQKGLGDIDGLDLTPAMMEQAKKKNVYSRIFEGDMTNTGLTASHYGLITNVLSDEHIENLKPLHKEVARLLKPGGVYVSISYHPFFLISGIPTHFDNDKGESLAINNYVHLISDHFESGKQAGLELVELKENVVTEDWVKKSANLKKHLGKPMSLMTVWKKS